MVKSERQMGMEIRKGRPTEVSRKSECTDARTVGWAKCLHHQPGARDCAANPEGASLINWSDVQLIVLLGSAGGMQ